MQLFSSSARIHCTVHTIRLQAALEVLKGRNECSNFKNVSDATTKEMIV